VKGGELVDPRSKIWRLVGVCLMGAVTLETILLFSSGLSDTFTTRQIPSHLAAISVGAVGGWIFELFRELHDATRASIAEFGSLSNSVEALTSKISYQDRALSMLMTCPRHNEVLTSLLKASMSDHLKNIPFVGVGDYLSFLRTAIEHSNGYQGIQRRPLRWFRETDAEFYLEHLRERRMQYKTRLILLDDEDAAAMREDLANQETLDYYWQATGDVQTYWTTVSEFRTNYPGFQVPEDLGLYDHVLLIAYDENRQILTFDICNEHSPEVRIFEIYEQLVAHRMAGFREVTREATGETK
jgi:hypothetical protein